MFPGAIYRENFFRMVNNSAMTPWFAGGLYLDSPLAIRPDESRNTLVENNVIELTDPRVINYYLSEPPTVFNNASPGGARISLYHTIAPGGSYERATTVDDRIAAGIEEAVVCSI